ncbi:MAG: hypothetical protein ACTJHL_13345, partial [Neisseriaceae bacterium]
WCPYRRVAQSAACPPMVAHHMMALSPAEAHSLTPDTQNKAHLTVGFVVSGIWCFMAVPL